MKRSALKKLSEVELVKLYRKNTSDTRLRSLIFNTMLFDKQTGGKTWEQNIASHARRSRYRLFYHDTGMCNTDDLYQEILKAFHKTLDEWFDVNSKYGFGTYAWYVINTAVDRVFQTSRTIKRKINKLSGIDINESYGDNKKVADVITERDFGVLRTIDKKPTFEDVLFHRDVLNFLKKSFVPEIINESDSLVKELMGLIKKKSASGAVLNNLAIKYDKTTDDILKLKQKLMANLEKNMFNDIINFIEYQIKDDGILATKYNCSRSQITKTKQRLSEVAKTKLKKANILSEYI